MHEACEESKGMNPFKQTGSELQASSPDTPELAYMEFGRDESKNQYTSIICRLGREEPSGCAQNPGDHTFTEWFNTIRALQVSKNVMMSDSLKLRAR